jgi:ABC-type Fe3+-siderophore transport system permease subunit
MASLATELTAFKRCFHFHAGNSNPQKIATWAALAVGGVIVLGQAFGFVDYDHLAPVTKMLVNATVAVALYLIGRVHGSEVAMLLTGNPSPAAPAGPAAAHDPAHSGSPPRDP